MADETPEIVADTRCHTGEGPIYHPDRDVVYFVDIPRGHLYRYDPATGDHDRVHEDDGMIGGFTIQDDGDLLLFCDRGRIQPWSPDDGLGDPVVERIDGEADSRFNDVIADPEGRVFGGTMPTDDRSGTLYRLDRDGSLTVVEPDVALPNGMGFSPERDRLYVTETVTDRIYRYDYDRSTGAATDREVFVDASDVDGHPDGMTVDADGFVWAAFWDGERLARYSPDGVEERRVRFPARKVSCVTFGDPTYETAYVTTALGPGEGEAGTRDEEGSGAGALFEADLGVAGVPEFRSRIGR